MCSNISVFIFYILQDRSNVLSGQVREINAKIYMDTTRTLRESSVCLILFRHEYDLIRVSLELCSSRHHQPLSRMKRLEIVRVGTTSWPERPAKGSHLDKSEWAAHHLGWWWSDGRAAGATRRGPGSQPGPTAPPTWTGVAASRDTPRCLPPLTGRYWGPGPAACWAHDGCKSDILYMWRVKGAFYETNRSLRKVYYELGSR